MIRPGRQALYGAIVLALCLTLAACSGGDYSSPTAATVSTPAAPSGTTPAPTPTPTPTATTVTASVSSLTLSVNDPSLNAALTGNPRQLTITNTGTADALDVTVTMSPSLPAGTTVSPASCATIPANGGTCVLTFTPGSTPTAAVGNTSPVPDVASIVGSNTNTVTSEVAVVTYGNVYQSGYIFSVDDTTATTGSIGAKVAALTDQSTGIEWGGFGTLTNASSLTDGASNSTAIVTTLGTGTSYAAGLCSQSIGGYSDWYLPAICELGYGTNPSCGTSASPLAQNLQSSLVDNGNVGAMSGYYWSSSEYSASPQNIAWLQYAATGGGSAQFDILKLDAFKVRCVRAATN